MMSFAWRVKCLEAIVGLLLPYFTFFLQTGGPPTLLFFLICADEFLAGTKNYQPPSTYSRLETKPSLPFTGCHCSVESELFSPSRVPIPKENSESQPLQRYHVFHGTFRVCLESFDAPRPCSLRRCCREGNCRIIYLYGHAKRGQRR